MAEALRVDKVPDQGEIFVKDFDNNYIMLFETGKAGICPRCGSAKLTAEEIVRGRHYGVFFTCPDCGAFDHADGRIEPDNPNWHRNKMI